MLNHDYSQETLMIISKRHLLRFYTGKRITFAFQQAVLSLRGFPLGGKSGQQRAPYSRKGRYPRGYSNREENNRPVLTG